MIRVHVLTACTRPDNLSRVGSSVCASAGPDFDIRWHVAFDPQREHVGGQGVKNRLLRQATDGWVLILDDDTLLHPGLLPRLRSTLAADTRVDMLVVAQERSDGRILTPSRETIGVGHVDIGQAVVLRSTLGELRIPELYEGDGIFLEQVCERARHPVFLDEVLSFHNALAR